MNFEQMIKYLIWFVFLAVAVMGVMALLKKGGIA
jgi:hypothetical protein